MWTAMFGYSLPSCHKVPKLKIGFIIRFLSSPDDKIIDSPLHILRVNEKSPSYYQGDNEHGI